MPMLSIDAEGHPYVCQQDHLISGEQQSEKASEGPLLTAWVELTALRQSKQQLQKQIEELYLRQQILEVGAAFTLHMYLEAHAYLLIIGSASASQRS